MIEYRDNAAIQLDDLLNLYADAGWSSYTDKPDKLRYAHDNSLYCVSAWKGSELAGLIRVVGDGASIVYVQDLLVKTGYRRQGIGKRLLNRVLAHFSGIRQFVLITDNTLDTKRFYESCSMRALEDYNCRAFVHYNLDA